MTRLIDALNALGLNGEIGLSGRWVKVQGERCAVYLVETIWDTNFFTWCDEPCDRTVHFYRDPVEAIKASLRRAAKADGA